MMFWGPVSYPPLSYVQEPYWHQQSFPEYKLAKEIIQGTFNLRQKQRQYSSNPPRTTKATQVEGNIKGKAKPKQKREIAVVQGEMNDETKNKEEEQKLQRERRAINNAETLNSSIRDENWSAAKLIFLDMAKESAESSRAAQDVFADLDLRQQKLLACALKNYVLEFIVHEHANFVVEKVFDRMPFQSSVVKELREELLGHVYVMACHNTACRSIKWVLDDKYLAKELLDRLHDLFGNTNGKHVLRHALECMPQYRSKIANAIVSGKKKTLLEYAAEKNNKEFIPDLFRYCVEDQAKLANALLDNDFSKLKQSKPGCEEILKKLNLGEVGCGHIQQLLAEKIRSSDTKEEDRMSTASESTAAPLESVTSSPRTPLL